MCPRQLGGCRGAGVARRSPSFTAVQRVQRVHSVPQVDAHALMALQMRISEQVQKKFGVSDEQVRMLNDLTHVS